MLADAIEPMVELFAQSRRCGLRIEPDAIPLFEEAFRAWQILAAEQEERLAMAGLVLAVDEPAPANDTGAAA